MRQLIVSTLTSAILDPLMASDPAGPPITYYDDATGERIELSTATMANWAAKTGNLLRDELGAQQRNLVAQILAGGGKKAPEAKVEAWMQRDDSTLRFTMAMLNDLLSQKSLDYPTLSVAARRLAQLATAGE